MGTVGRDRGRAGWGGAALCAAALVLPACRSFGARVHNLRELHHEDGGTSYSAALMGELEYNLRSALKVSTPLGGEIDFGDKQADAVANPSARCLENLRDLVTFEREDPHVLALQTEMLVWLAVGDPYVLARERAVIALGPIARDLGVREPLRPEGEPPTVEELAATLTDLVAAARRALRGDEVPPDAVPLAEVCRRLGEQEHDLRTARRALRTLGALLGARGAERDVFEPVHEALRSVGRRASAIALTRVLEDPSPWVRAAGVDAWMTASGGGAGEVFAGASRDPHPLVVHRVLAAIAEHGLPRPMDEAIDPEQWRESWIANLVTTAVNSPDGQISAAACRALSRVSGAELDTLRFDAWYAWWVDRMEAREEGS